MFSKIKELRSNKWAKFTVVSLIYTLWFVLWMGNLWMLLGLVVIFDVYISKIMNRLFWDKHKQLKTNNVTYKKSAEWVEAIVFATVVASLIRSFFFELFVIPTSSMEKSLLVGDYLVVSKMSYGPKLPNTPIAFPFVHHTMPFSQTKKSYSEAIKLPYKRLKGFGSIERGDAVVFNFPAGDTVLLENQSVTYYDVLRSYQEQLGLEEGRKRLNQDFTVISRPVDKRENYIKRAVGMPGDSLMIKHSQLNINGKLYEPIDGLQFVYFVTTNGTPISEAAFEDMGIAKEDIIYNHDSKTYTIPLTKANADRISKMRNVVLLEQYESVPKDGYCETFPYDDQYDWTGDNFGPIWIPKKGATVQLNSKNLPLYSRVIKEYEGNDLKVKDNVIYINNDPSDSYTFKMDYYFMMGDNRHNSADSRYWGFVPEDHIVGKAVVVGLSLDKEKSFPTNIRWNRILKSVK